MAWPGRSSFAQPGPAVEFDDEAAIRVAERMGEALAEGDLQRFSRWVAKAPEALFMEGGEGRRGAIAALDHAEPSFAFDAGAAWAAAAGERFAGERGSRGVLSHVEPRIASGRDARRAALAFACGAMGSPFCPKSVSEAVWRAGAKGSWTRQEPGAAEIEIWGGEWARQADERNELPHWCSAVLGQAALRGAEGLEADCEALAQAARGLGSPLGGWLSSALRLARDEGDSIWDNASKHLRRQGGQGAKGAEALADAAKLRWMEAFEDAAARLCEAGPASWAEGAFAGKANPRLAAKIEAALLRAQLPSPSRPPAAPKRV